MKKTLSTIIAASLLLTGLCAVVSAEDAPLPCVTENAGDANADSVVNAKDVTALMKYCAGSAELAAFDLADVNRDGAVNAKDVAALLKYLAGFDVFPGHGDVQISESDEGRTVVCAACGYVFEGQTDPGEAKDEPTPSTMTNVFDITDFGAVGDGVTDCTEAIQAALDEAHKAQGKVVIPPGNYLTGYLKVDTHTSIEGVSGWSFGGNGLSTLILNDAKAKCLLDITNAYQCTVKNLCLSGKFLGTNVHGIYIYHKSDFGGETPFIDECRIEHFTGDGIHFEREGVFKIYHSMMYENRGAGLYVFGCDAFLLDNWFTGNHNCGFYSNNIGAVTFTGNRVEWNGVAGVKFDCGDRAQFTGNFFDRNSGPALWLGSEEWLYNGVSVSGNIFCRNGNIDISVCESPYERSHLYLEKVTNAAVTGNTFILAKGDGDTGEYTPDYCIFLDLCDAVTVQGNAMKNGAMKESVIWDGHGECIFEGNVGVTGIRPQAVSDWDDFE